MKEGPYIFWQSEQDYEEVYFVQKNNSIQEEKLHKNLKEQPNINFKLDQISISVDLQKEFEPSASRFSNVDKIFAIGDIHGEFDILKKILLSNRIIDQNFSWNFGEGHLVFCGDIFDRGSKVTECLWLVYHLEQQAELVGGKVHYLWGNHEIMSLVGDHRYLHQKYNVLSFNFLSDYKDFFANDSVLGCWIRQKNIAVSINDYLFVHAGIDPKINLSIEEINNKGREELSQSDFSQFLMAPDSPLWYRGYMQYWEGVNKATQSDIDLLLDKFEIKQLIFAHTEVKELTPLFNNKLIAIDVPLKKQPEGLLIKGDAFYRVDEYGNQKDLF